MFLFPLCLGFQAVDESQDYAAEDYARNVLNALPPNALLLSNQGSVLVTPATYLQQVEGFRPDVTVLDYTMLASPWFYRELETRWPWLAQNSKAEIEALIVECRSLEEKPSATLEDTLQFSRRLVETVQSFFRANAEAHPLYVTGEVYSDFTTGWLRLPEGLVYRLAREVPAHLPRLADISFRPIPPAFPLREQLALAYALGYTNQGIYAALALRDTASARPLFRKALEVKPDFESAYRWLQSIGG